MISVYRIFATRKNISILINFKFKFKSIKNFEIFFCIFEIFYLISNILSSQRFIVFSLLLSKSELNWSLSIRIHVGRNNSARKSRYVRKTEFWLYVKRCLTRMSYKKGGVRKNKRCSDRGLPLYLFDWTITVNTYL